MAPKGIVFEPFWSEIVYPFKLFRPESVKTVVGLKMDVNFRGQV